MLDTLEEAGLLDDTLIIRTADHGEMGMTHGGMRQKNFNFYEEATRVPLVYSNPKLFPRPPRTDALVSHVDFLPTLASLSAPRVGPRRLAGGGLLRASSCSRKRAKPVQDYIVFTYDDFQSGQANGPYPKPPNHIVSIREERWKLAKYYDVEPATDAAAVGDVRPQDRPARADNLAYKGYKRTPEQERQFRRLRRKLARVEKTRLQPLS